MIKKLGCAFNNQIQVVIVTTIFADKNTKFLKLPVSEWFYIQTEFKIVAFKTALAYFIGLIVSIIYRVLWEL